MNKPLDTATAYKEVVSKIVLAINPNAQSGDFAIADPSLADVLRAFPKKLWACADSPRTIELFPRDDLFSKKSKNIYALWAANLALSKQSDKTILFLHTLLHA